MALPAALVRPVTRRIDHTVGGPARRRVILVLALVLALDSADKATVGTSATQLEAALGVGKPQIGLLLAVASGVGALATIPAGIAVDRARRTRLLAWAVTGWGAATLLSGLATGYVFLLVTRVALGAMVALAGPAVASLLGDYFPERERGRIYGFVLSGELIGAGFGFAVAGQFASLSWRAPFFVLVPPTVLVWWLLIRLPEPERGGPSRMRPGTVDLARAAAGQDTAGDQAGDDDAAGNGTEEQDLAHRMARRDGVEPRRSAVLTTPAGDLSTRQAFRQVLAVRTNVVLIVASALGYFFFSGLRGFAIQFAKEHYRVSQGVASALTLLIGIGALLGVLVSGRLADRLLRRGHLTARVQVPGVAVLCAAAAFVPALITTSVGVAIPLLALAAAFLGASNPPLDAARLDVMVPGLWGRAEAVRTLFRNAGDASAPLLFGVLSASVFGGTTGLEYTFLLMLVTLVAGAVITLTLGRRTYPSDVAAAAESRRP